jgi:hypothetical protein
MLSLGDLLNWTYAMKSKDSWFLDTFFQAPVQAEVFSGKQDVYPCFPN